MEIILYRIQVTYSNNPTRILKKSYYTDEGASLKALSHYREKWGKENVQYHKTEVKWTT